MATDELLAVELFIGGDEAEVLVDGELDMTTAHILEDRVLACAADARLRAITLDLRGVSFCDGAGFRAVVRSRRHASDHQLSCCVRSSRAVRRIAEIAGEPSGADVAC